MPSDEDSVWSEKTLADLSEKSRYGINAKASGNADGPKFLRITDIVPDSIDWLSVPHCDVSADDFVKYQLQPGDLVIARSGSVGYAKQISESDPAAVFASYLVRFRALPEVDADFLAAIVCSAGYRSWVLQNATGVAQPNANAQILGSFPIRVPPIPVQKRIGSLATTLNRLIECNRRRIELLEETARLLYREWFVNFRYPGYEDVPLVDSGLGPIPQDWETRSFNEVADFINGFAFKSSEHWLEEGLPIIKIKELKAGLSDDTPRYHGNDIDTKYFIDNGDVLFSWSAHLDAYVWAGGPGLLNQHLFVVKPYELSKLFVFHSLRGQMTEFRARAQGTTMKHIKRSALGQVLLRVPPPGIRQQFEQAVGPMLDLQLELQSSNRLLTEIRDLLLPRLVSGDLDISDLDLSLEAVG